jgi:hypothetical protein
MTRIKTVTMEKKIIDILENYKIEGAKKDMVTEELLILFSVSKCYTEKDMDNAYDKGFNNGNKHDLTGSLIEVL